MNIDVSTIEPLITERTKMIAPIDYAGIPRNIETIMNLAEKYNLMLMKDAAQSFHSIHKNGKPCGTLPTMAAFSCHETKNIICGQGMLKISSALIDGQSFFPYEKTMSAL